MTPVEGPATPQWERWPRSLTIALLACAAVLLALYHYGIPIAARAAAARVPDAVADRLGDQVLRSLDEQLEASSLPAARQQEIEAAFLALLPPEDRDKYRVLFRGSPTIGANAFALPSGAIVLTDELVALARDDRELLGVLAHEAGHVEARHGLRLVFQSSALFVIVGWVVGDFTSILAIAPTVLLQAKYSRDLEREADAWAAHRLRAHGIPPARLADLLERIEAASAADAEGGGGRASGGASLLDYASTHPATRERLEYLRSQ